MSKQVVKNYTFNTGAKTVTLTDFSAGQPVRLDRLALITDTTTNQILYNFADSTIATAAVSSNNVITLSTLPGGVANGDSLRIDYDTVAGDPTYDTGNSQVKLTDGTNTVNVLKSDGTAAGQNAQLVAPSYLSVPFSVSASGPMTAVDAANYRWISVQVATTSSGVAPTFQISNDNTTWWNTPLFQSLSTASTGVVTTGTNSTGIWYGPITARYFRLNLSGSVTTFAGTMVFSSAPSASATIGVSGSVGSNSATGSTVPANAFYAGFIDASGNLAGARLGTLDGSSSILGTAGYVYNGTNQDRVRAANTAAGTTGTGVLGAGILGFDGTNYQRVKTDASGNLSFTGGTSDGTNVGNVLKSDGTAAGQNAQMVARSHLAVAFSTTTVQAVGTTDAANYSAVSVHVSTQGTNSTVSFQGSNDNTNWVNVALMTSSAIGSSTPSISTTTSNIIYSGALNFRYFRLNVAGISAGTTAGTIEFLTTPYAGNTSTINVNSNSATGATVPSNAFYVAANNDSGLLTGLITAKRVSTSGSNNTPGDTSLSTGVIAQYNTTAPTPTAGNFSNLQIDSAANLKVYLASKLDATNDAITAYPAGHSYTNITTNATTVIKVASGFLKGVTINNPSALTGTTLTLTMYDNSSASGNKIGTWTVPTGLTSALPFKIDFDLTFATALTIVTAGPTVPADITVEWR